MEGRDLSVGLRTEGTKSNHVLEKKNRLFNLRGSRVIHSRDRQLVARKNSQSSSDFGGYQKKTR